MNVLGDVITWDVANFARLAAADGAVQWSRAVYPTVAVCPLSLPSLSLTNNSDAVYVLPGLGEVGAYVTNGVPQSDVDLRGNDSGTVVFPAPQLVPRAALAQRPATDGIFIPLAQPVVNGARVVVVARYYNTSNDVPALMMPTASLYLAAVDQRNAAVDRMHFAWQWVFPQVPALLACVPAQQAAAPFANISGDPLLIAGPMGVRIGSAVVNGVGYEGTVIVALSCPSKTGAGEGIADGNRDGATVETHVFAVAVNGVSAVRGTHDEPAVPSLLWHTAVESPTGSVGATQLLGAPTAGRLIGNGDLVWIVFDGSDEVVLLNATTGDVVGTLNITLTLSDTVPDSGCSSALNKTVGGGSESALPSGPLISSLHTTGAVSPSDATTSSLLFVPFVVASRPTPSGSRSSMESAWVAVVAVADRVSDSKALWCSRLPRGALRGQAAVAAGANATAVIIAASDAGIVAFAPAL